MKKKTSQSHPAGSRAGASKEKKYVYFFGEGKAAGHAGMKNLLGGNI